MRAYMVLCALSVGALGCEGKKPGEHCDGFFQDSCKRPLICIATGTEKICGAKCEAEQSGNACADPSLHPQRVLTHAGGDPAGCYCVP